MSPEILSALIQVIGAIAIALVSFFAGRRIQLSDRNRQRIIETGVTSTELINPDKLGPISMSVDEGFITGKRSESGKLLPVKSAYNYVIGVSNIGLDDLEKPEIDIILNGKASIVEVKVKSDNIPQDKFEYQKDSKKPNSTRIVPEYLNRNDSFAISVLSINEPTPNCEIMVGGKGIFHRTRSSSPERASSNPSLITIASIATVLAVIFTGVGLIIAWLQLNINHLPIIITTPTP